MKEFRNAKEVKCIDVSTPYGYYFTLGKVYELKGYREGTGDTYPVCVVNDSGGLHYCEEKMFEPVKEPTPFGKSLFGYKIKVKDEEQFNLIQEAIAEVGGKWLSGNRLTNWMAAYNYIYIDQKGYMSRGGGSEEDKSCWPTLSLETVKTLRIVDTIPVKTQAEIEKENLQKVIDKLQQDLDNAKQQLNSIGGK